MTSTILGWLLVLLGIVSYLGALMVWLRSQFAAPPAKSLPEFKDTDLNAIAEVLDKLAKVLNSYSRLSVPVQWALLGLAQIGVGSYLIVSKPF
jgi:hypothetical protein